MAVIVDLREYPRTGGDDVVAQMGDELVEIIDISVAGIRLARPQLYSSCRNVDFHIIPRSRDGLDVQRAVPVCGHVVGGGDDHLRIAFASVTMALANIIGCYEGRNAPPASASVVQL